MKLFKDNVYQSIAQATAPESDIERFVRSVYHDEDLQRGLNRYAQKNSLPLRKFDDLIIYDYKDSFQCNGNFSYVTHSRLVICFRPEEEDISKIKVFYNVNYDLPFPRRVDDSHGNYSILEGYDPERCSCFFVENEMAILLRLKSSLRIFDEYDTISYQDVQVQEFTRLISRRSDGAPNLWGKKEHKGEYNPFILEHIPLKVLMSGLEKAIEKVIK
ncbi:MAG: hypothetical protein V2A62_02160 [Candidatus Woesearchaeota archaeon]